MMNYKKAIGLVMFVALSILQAQAQVSSPPKWNVFQKFATTNLKQAEQTVINTEGEWQSFYHRATGRQASAAPKFGDWVSQRLVVVAIGECKGTGFSVDVATVSSERVGTATIEWYKQSPQRDNNSSRTVTSPCVVISIEKVGSGRLNFVETEAPRIQPQFNGNPGWNPYQYDRPQLIPWTYVNSGINSTLRQWGATCMSTPQDLEQYWDQAQRGSIPRYLKEYDWRNKVLVAIHLGSVFAGSSIGVDGIVVGSDYRVYIKWYEKPPFAITAGAATESPFLIFEMPRYTTRPIFQKMVNQPR